MSGSADGEGTGEVSVADPQDDVRRGAIARRGRSLRAATSRYAVLAVGAVFALTLGGGDASAERVARLEGAPGAERIVTDSPSPVEHRNPESGLPTLTPPKPADILEQGGRPAAVAETAETAETQALAPTGDVEAMRLPEDLWTAMAVLAALVTFAIAGWFGARLAQGSGQPVAAAPAGAQTLRRAPDPLGDSRVRRALEGARRAIALDAVLAPERTRDDHALAGADPVRIALEMSPARRRARALARAAERGFVSRPVRPLGFAYASARRRRFADRQPGAASASAAAAGRAVGAVQMADFYEVKRPHEGRHAPTRPDVAPPEKPTGEGDKGDRISNVIRGIAAFDARHRSPTRDRG